MPVVKVEVEAGGNEYGWRRDAGGEGNTLHLEYVSVNILGWYFTMVFQVVLLRETE